MKKQLAIIPLAVLLVASGAIADPRDTTTRPIEKSAAAVSQPQGCAVEHNVGNMALGIDNYGMFGDSYVSNTNFFTGAPIQSCQFPKGDSGFYLWAGALWVGGIIGTDTLVSVGFDGASRGREMNPDVSPYGAMQYKSSISSEAPLRYGAVSHQDFYATYYDTCVLCYGMNYNPYDKRFHMPMGIRVDQASYAWQYPHAENAVIITYDIQNFQSKQIRDAYVGVYFDGDVYSPPVYSTFDDEAGFIDSMEVSPDCPSRLHLPLAWAADNEGDWEQLRIRLPHVVGGVMLTPPAGGQHLSSNWYAYADNYAADMGPMRRSNARPFYSGTTGLPLTDRDKYFLLSNGDIDYDQPFAGTISPVDTQWLFPGSVGSVCASGGDPRCMLSLGPYDLSPGQHIRVAFALVCGYDLHQIWGNEFNLPGHPQIYERWLNFLNLKKNALNAAWIYDNPGVDTDSDGYAGRYQICASDTIWYEGDGIPDLRADWPPPKPTIRVLPTVGGAVIHWNGEQAEKRINWFSKTQDFEGYRVYLRPAESTTWDTIASYDIENYLRVHWNTSPPRWECHEYPYTTDSLRCRFAPAGCNDQSWKPRAFSPVQPYSPPDFPDSLFYFAPVGCNASRLGHDTHIVKAYPNAIKPRYSSASEVPADSTEYYLTPDGTFKYYEYELTIAGLSVADTFAVTVTSLSNGRASLDGHNPLESSIHANVRWFRPLSAANCCLGVTGNVDCSPGGSVDIADLTALIDYLYISMTPLCCVGEANTDGDPADVIDIADLTRLIDFLYVNFTTPAGCE